VRSHYFPSAAESRGKYWARAKLARQQVQSERHGLTAPNSNHAFVDCLSSYRDTSRAFAAAELPILHELLDAGVRNFAPAFLFWSGARRRSVAFNLFLQGHAIGHREACSPEFATGAQRVAEMLRKFLRPPFALEKIKDSLVP
jgi:hypothetical protein